MLQRMNPNRSVKARLLLVMVLIAGVPLFAALLISGLITRSNGYDSAEKLNVTQAGLVAEKLQATLDMNMEAVRAVATSPSTVKYLKGDKSLESEVFAQLLTLDAEFGDGNSMAISDTTGQQLLRTVGNPLDISEREYFQQAMQGQTYISNVQVSKSTGQRITTLAAPVVDSDGKIVGMVQRNYDLEDLHDIIATQVTEDRQEIVIVDDNGDVVAHSTHSIDPSSPESQAGNPFYTDSRGTVTQGTYISVWAGETWYISWEKLPESGWVIASCQLYSVALAYVNEMIVILLAMGIIFVVLAALVAIWQSGSIVKPVKVIDEALGALADGQFKSIKNFKTKPDELGNMIQNTNAVIDKLEGIVASIKSVSGNVDASSTELADMANQISQTAEDVANAIQDIARGATIQADEVQMSSTNVDTISDAVSHVQQSTSSLEELAERMKDASQTSSQSLSNLQQSSNGMTAMIENIAETIKATQDAVNSINERVESISSIATQTNLLSLNASIEAARAGDAGRGFAVVAEEIGKLATESATMADGIRTEMDKLLSQSKAAVTAAENVKNGNEEQQVALGETLTSVQGMIEDVESTVKEVQQISVGAKQCGEAKDVVAESMEKLSEISEENAAASEETGASMEELSATVTTLATAAGNLQIMAGELNSEMEFFKS